MYETVPDDAWRVAVEFAKHPMGFVGEDSRFVWVNPAYEALLGYSLIELRDMSWEDITVQHDIGGDRDSVKAVLRGEIQEYTMAKRYKHKFGHKIPVILSVIRFPRVVGEPFACFIVEAAPVPASTMEVEELRKQMTNELEGQKAAAELAKSVTESVKRRLVEMEKRMDRGDVSTSVNVGTATGIGGTSGSGGPILILAATIMFIAIAGATIWVSFTVLGSQDEHPPHAVEVEDAPR